MSFMMRVAIFLAACAMTISLKTTPDCSHPLAWKTLLRDAFREDDKSKVITQNLRFMLMNYFRDSSIICLTGQAHLVEICNNPDYLSGAPEAWIFSNQYPLSQNPRNVSFILLAAYENYYRLGFYLETIFHNTNNFMRRRNGYYIEGTLKILTVMRRLLRKYLRKCDFETAMKRVESIRIPGFIKCRNLTAIEEEKLFAAAIHDAVTNAHQLVLALRRHSNAQ